MVDYEMKQKVNKHFTEMADLYQQEPKCEEISASSVVSLMRKSDGSVYVDSEEDISEISNKELQKGDNVILDFGTHIVGYVTLKMKSVGSPQDAPAYIKLKFGEIAKEILEKAEDYDGWISSSWIQEEYIHIDTLPAVITLPRRYAFRYLQVNVIDTSSKWQLVLEKVICKTVSAVEELAINQCLETQKQKREMLKDEKLINNMLKLETISLRTLKNCMQDVFEDGPKRDRRLWLGDLRLQALANYASFKNYDLVRRCLYLFAGLTREDGKVGACLFTKPVYQVDNVFFFDYSLFFICTLRDYYVASNDKQILKELWECAAKQLEISGKEFNEDGWIRADTKYNSFIDWKDGLDKQACSQAVYIYAAEALKELADILGKTKYKEQLDMEIQRKKAAAWKYSWNEEKGFFVSGSDQQVSYATQAWMILAKVVDSQKGKEILGRLASYPDAIGMVTPYMNHHYTEALFMCGMADQAFEYMNYYWGGMAARGADTFWELYNPENPEETPYGSSIVNSYCHAWSCTPIYLIRKYIYKNM